MVNRNTLTEFGKVVKKGMIDQGINQTQLAKRIGTSERFLAHILYGRRPGKAYVKKIANALNIDLSQFEDQGAAG